MTCPLYLAEGDIVRFKYQGGSNPGSTRNIYVLSVDKKNIKAWDFEREAIRSFCGNKMSDVEFINDEYIKQLDLTSLPVDFIDVSTLIDQYNSDGYKVYCNDGQLIAVQINNKKSNKLICSQDYHTIYFEQYQLVLCEDGSVSMYYGDRWINNATIDDLKNLLEKV